MQVLSVKSFLNAHFLVSVNCCTLWICKSPSKLCSSQLANIGCPCSILLLHILYLYNTSQRVFDSDVFWIITSITDIFISDAKKAGNMLVYFRFLCCLVGCFCSNRTKRGSCMKYSYYL